MFRFRAEPSSARVVVSASKRSLQIAKIIIRGVHLCCAKPNCQRHTYQCTCCEHRDHQNPLLDTLAAERHVNRALVLLGRR